MDLATMCIHNAMDYAQSQSSTLSNVFRGKEWIEKLLQNVLRHTRPGISYLNHDRVAATPSCDCKRSAIVHCLNGVDGQIDEHLPQLNRVPLDLVQVPLRLLHHFDPLIDTPAMYEGERLTNNIGNGGPTLLDWRLSGKNLQLVHDLTSLETRSDNLVQIPPSAICHTIALLSQLCEPQDAAERLIDFVRYPRHQLADGGQPVCVMQLLLQSATFCRHLALLHVIPNLSRDRLNQVFFLFEEGTLEGVRHLFHVANLYRTAGHANHDNVGRLPRNYLGVSRSIRVAIEYDP
jgi:hypothetical protein